MSRTLLLVAAALTCLGAAVSAQSPTIKEWDVPTRGSHPHDPLAAADGSLWWTGQFSDTLGRLDPKTGAMKEWASPGGPTAQPYGIAAAKGAIWYSESGLRPNTLVRFDPKTERFETWPIPSGGGVVRNMMATRGGDLVLACSGVDKVALVDVP